MTLKIIAIIILALLGLSSVMSPKAFRVFVGGLIPFTAMLLLGFVLLSKPSELAKNTSTVGQLASKLSSLLGMQPNWDDAAESASQQVLAELERAPGRTAAAANERDAAKPREDADKTATTRPRVLLRKFGPVSIQGDSPEQQRTWLIEHIRVVLSDGLAYYQRRSNDIGVDRLTVENLDPRLVKWVPTKDQAGQQYVTFFLDEAFLRHLPMKGRHLVMKERLELAAIAAVVVAALLCLSYGLLKVVHLRRQSHRADDYLQASNVSMV